jgi:hypothetical protein
MFAKTVAISTLLRMSRLVRVTRIMKVFSCSALTWAGWG